MSGTPFLSELCDPEDADNLIIYGHHMSSGKMFATLDRYKSEEFYQEHPIIQYSTLHGKELKLKLKKDPDNKFDKEAIVVKKEGLGEIGHVVNSAHTVIGESMSAGRIYDKIGDTAKARVVLVTPHGTICSLSKKSCTVSVHV